MIKFKLRVVLAQRELTQKDLAERTGIRPPTISAIARGEIKEFPIGAMDKICKVLECQPADLIEYVPDKPIEE